MTAALKVLAVLFHYPDDAVRDAADELVAAVDEDGLLGGRHRRAVADFIHRLRDGELLAAQADYVETFDRGRARSLYVYEHLHGESRDRGQAMVALNQLYREHGFAISARELPDYLPLFLEFLSQRPLEEALHWLEEIGEVLQVLHARLAARESPYAPLMEILVRLAGLPPDEAGVRENVAKERPDDTPEALDQVWAEAPVTFGPEDSGYRTMTPQYRQPIEPGATPLRWVQRTGSPAGGGEQ